MGSQLVLPSVAIDSAASPGLASRKMVARTKRFAWPMSVLASCALDRCAELRGLGAEFVLRIGIRQGLSAIMTASLIFTAADVPELNNMHLC